jgi:hypothetical protein
MCSKLASFAGTVMFSRHIGLPGADALAACETADTTGEFGEACQAMVTHSYSQPMQDTDEARHRAVAEWLSSYYLACMGDLDSVRKKVGP